MDDRFCFDSIWYVLERDDHGDYAFVRYADNKDNKLISVLVTSDGYAEYKPWNVTFQFTDGWTRVYVVKKHQSDIEDRVEREWCEFDEKTVNFS